MSTSPSASSLLLRQKLVDNFLRYAAISSQSDAKTGTLPSSPGQMTLARQLKAELEALGLVDIKLGDNAILTARLPARLPAMLAGKVPAIGFLAHLDTVNVHLSPDVKPRLVHAYPGGDLCLNADKNLWLRTAEHPEIERYVGQDLLVSDGTSVLGADNKAGIAAIMAALSELLADPDARHGDLHVAFVPDEEIGLLGAKAMDLADFPVAFAYTLDSCELGEVVYETFNAASVSVEIQGITAHPMSAKGVLVNPTLAAIDFINHFDRHDTPEHTEGKEGYFWVRSVSTNDTLAVVKMNIRDHDKARFEARKQYIADVVRLVEMRHPKAKFKFGIEDSYGNIADALGEDTKACVDIIYRAMDRLGIEAKTVAMRGGTDGSCLSARGIPTPNFFTGAHNFHSPCEFLPIPSFELSCRMVLEISRLVSETD